MPYQPVKTLRGTTVAALLIIMSSLAVQPAHAQRRRRNLPPAPKDGDFQPRRLLREFEAIKDAPVVKAGEIGDALRDDELVLGVVRNGEARAYPINMLTGPAREIVNDTLGGEPIAATW